MFFENRPASSDSSGRFLFTFYLNRTFIFFSVTRKKTEAKERVQKRPELRGRNTNSSNHSKNSLRSNSFSYFVTQIAFRNPRLNIDSKNLHSSKDLFVRNVFENGYQYGKNYVYYYRIAYTQKHSARGGIYRLYYYRNRFRFLCRVCDTSKST